MKKILALCLCVILAVTAVTGATLAYFTDTDAETNVFTTGKVDIDLEENFDEDDAKLFPGKENAIQKEVWIELEEGSEDSYVWYTYAIPAELDSKDGSTGTNNDVHVNAFGKTWDKYWQSDAYTLPAGAKVPTTQYDTWDHDPNVELPALVGPEGYIGSYTEDGIEYNVYLVLYHGVLTHATENVAENTTSADRTVTTIGMSQVYMDAGVNYDNTKGYYVDKNGEKIDYDFTKDIKIPVKAYAIQAEGFDDVYAAYQAFPVVIE